MKNKLLYINGHLSTGGSCQYTLKQIQKFKEQFDVSVIEVNLYSDQFTVQRDQIEEIVDFYPLYGRQEKLWPTIKKIQPSLISFQEVPNSFIEDKYLKPIFDGDWKITATAHSNRTRRKDFTYLPDRIIAVNKWQQQLFKEEFKNTTVDVGIWEYPIEDIKVSWLEKQEARARLNLDHGFHLLNTGLFTEGKNQAELFDIARSLPGCWFHCVGNQAVNFKDYWEPLMRNKPSNVIVWGERADLDNFYKAADIFLFTSNYELFPIVLRESLSYHLPTLMKRLPSYTDEYDNFPEVAYIDNDIQKTINIIDEYITRNR